MTFAVIDDASAELAGVAGSGDAALILPESVSYEGAEYSIASIAPYAFYLSGATDVVLPASITDVDDRAFRSSEVSSVEVAEGNPIYSSFDGALYDAGMTRLLLIPGGRQGAVRIPSQASDVPASAFSHCALVTAIDADAGGAAYLSWEGSLYDASGTMLLRVPAGATDITIREGCTAIAAGAMEGCASLERINAPATVASISPYLFEQEPTMLSPIAVLWASGEESEEVSPQVSAVVALSAVDDGLPKISPSEIAVSLPGGSADDVWVRMGFMVEEPVEEDVGIQDADALEGESVGSEYEMPIVSLQEANTYAANISVPIHANQTTTVTMSWFTNYSHTSTTYATINPGTPVTFSDAFARYMISSSSGTAPYMTFYYSEANWVTVTFASQDSNYSLLGIYNDSAYTMTSYNVNLYDSFTFYLCWMGNQRSASLWGNIPTNSTAANTLGTLYYPYASSRLYWDSAYKTEYTSASMPKPSRPGYTFGGFANGSVLYLDANGNKTSSFDTRNSYKLDAVWTAKTITLSWNSNGGSSIGNTSKTYAADAKVPMPSSNPTRAGYTFKGWFTATSGGTQVTSSTALPTSNTTYYAQWTAKTITLTWNSQGGSSVANTSATYSASAKVPMPSSNPTRAGYTFKGWFTATSGGTKVSSGTALPTSNTTYYAQWTANTITLTWNSQGGSSVANTSKTYASGAKVPMPSSNPTRAGYTFKGWFTATSGGTQITSNTVLPTSNTTYYAQWSANVITLTWNSNGGSSVANTTQTYSTTAKVTLPSSPTRAGYAFKGWFTAASGGTQVTSSTALPTSNTTYYAQWTANTITLTWNSQGGSSVANTSATYSASAKVPMPSSNPTRAGYTFKGWFTSTTSTTQVTSSTALPTTNTTYYAQWTANTITLTWNSQGGSSVANTSKIYASGAKVPMPSSNPTRAGYTFAGWWTAASGGTQVTSSTALPTANTTYHAHWNANTITLTWNSQGGSSIGNTSATYSASAKVPMPSSNPTRAGYTFKGWFTAASGGTQVTSSTALPTSNKTYHAQWTANTITLTWNSQGGSSIGNTSAIYSGSAKVPMPASNPTRAGYTFAGWWTAATGGVQVTSSTALPTANATYHAHWSLNPYSIAYELDGGSVSGNPTTYDVTTTTFTLKNPTRTGYAFTGWSGTGLSGDANKTVTIAKGSTGNRSYTAHWSANPYTVEYWDKAGATKLSSDDGFRYDTARNLAEKPTDALTAGYTATGWANDPGQEQARYGFGSSQRNLVTSGTKRLYLAESPNTITLTWNSRGSIFATTTATYGPGALVPFPDPGPATEPGWAFAGWWTEPDGGGEEALAGMALPTQDTSYYAHWVAVVAVDVPVSVDIKLDLLGIEETQDASGWIESRSALPLKVDAIDFEPLSGAATLFGSDTAAVHIEVAPGGTTGSDIAFALDKAATLSDARKLMAFILPYGYGTRMDVGYALRIDDQDVVDRIDPTRFEQVATPVCSVAYTVALA